MARKGTADAPFDDGGAPLRLYADDAEDLTVIATVLQDSVVRQSDLTYLASRHTFAGMFSRYRWEVDGSDKGRRERVRAGVRFSGVLGVLTCNLAREDTDTVLELLTIQWQTGEEGAGTVTLVFAGGAAIRLATECIDCELTDVGAPWPVERRPVHPIVDTS